VSRTQAQGLINAGRVTVGGRRARPSRPVAEGDVVAAESNSGEKPAAPAPGPHLTLRVIHADAAIIVEDKPAGIVVHPAAGHRAGTLVNALVARFPELGEEFEGERPGIVHRLDRDTSGVMVVARTPEAAAGLQGQFKSRQVEKIYLALAHGLPDPPEAVIDAPIGRDPRHRKRMAARADGKPARTIYKVVATGGGFALLEVKPLSGRTHQIRVHLAAVGHALAGDTVYGLRRGGPMPRQALHAWRLGLIHPSTGEKVVFTAPVAADLRGALEELGMELPEGYSPVAAE
ncbi:MAG: RluA family pseudouridine synthase, partial [Anaerolineae bacterium]